MIPELGEEETLKLANDFNFSGGQIENIARKRIITGILTGGEPDLASVINMRKEELLISKGAKIGFTSP